MPASMIPIEITQAKIGRPMKKRLTLSASRLYGEGLYDATRHSLIDAFDDQPIAGY